MLFQRLSFKNDFVVVLIAKIKYSAWVQLVNEKVECVGTGGRKLETHSWHSWHTWPLLHRSHSWHSWHSWHNWPTVSTVSTISFPFTSPKIHPKFSHINQFCFYFLSFPFISPKIHLSFPFISPKIHSTSFAFISFHFLKIHPKFTQNSFNQFCFHFRSFFSFHSKFIQNSFNEF